MISQPRPHLVTVDPEISLQERLNLQGYQSLLADYCQTVDQLAHLTQFAVAIWDSLQEIRQLLGLPRLPFPIAGSLAVAARPVVRPPCDPPDPAAAYATIDELIERMFRRSNAEWQQAKLDQILAALGDPSAPDKPSYQHGYSE